MKFVVFCYSQSGQALDVAKSICRGLSDGNSSDGMSVVLKKIVPEYNFPFPWGTSKFLDAFPESRLGVTIGGIQEIDMSDINDADLVVIVGQSWFLSPSLPLRSFFADEKVVNYLHGKKIVFVNACRNMWVSTLFEIQRTIKEIGAQLVGHIVLQDKAQNLVGVVTVIRWLVYGKKESTRFLPQAGISSEDIRNASKFGVIIRDMAANNKVDALQERLCREGGVFYRPSVAFVEKAGHYLFGFWAKFVIKKGRKDDPKRMVRLRMFYAFLLSVLFIVSPLGLLYFYLTYPFRNIQSEKEKICNLKI